jgi:Raf kinase inhibitor-like YbhB/YbcL family protein
MATIELRSPAFSDHATIPDRHTKAGEDVSPPLEWSGVPDGAAELAVLCEDPDAPGRPFVHWVLSGLDPSLGGLAEGEVPPGAVEGVNDFGRTGYGGPGPPVGDPPHRYFFRIYAASEPLGLSSGATAEDLRRALERRQLARGTIVGTYQR